MSAKVTAKHHQAVVAALAEFKADWNLLDTFGQADVLEQIIAQALADAEAAERWECETIASQYIYSREAIKIAEEIRARGQS